MDFNIDEIIKELMNPYEELFSRKSDVEITCKIVFKDLPTIYVHDPEAMKQLDLVVQQLKFNMAEIAGAKTSVKLKIKDKEPKKSKKKGDE